MSDSNSIFRCFEFFCCWRRVQKVDCGFPGPEDYINRAGSAPLLVAGLPPTSDSVGLRERRYMRTRVERRPVRRLRCFSGPHRRTPHDHWSPSHGAGIGRTRNACFEEPAGNLGLRSSLCHQKLRPAVPRRRPRDPFCPVHPSSVTSRFGVELCRIC
ncbi:hypothetical protein LX36DRAFT_353752 [Colletotrichum falcatum]|nr:hypothetical protein LX36DRAFT_353752 [Colletotrichum falcatum]